MINDSFAFHLVSVARLIRMRFYCALSEAGLDVPPAAANALLHIQRLEPVKQIALASAMGIEAMTLVNHLDRLESRQLIVRRVCVGDRRSKEIHLTAVGVAISEQVRAVLDLVVSESMRNFSPADVTMIGKYMELLYLEVKSQHADLL
ncbi:MarR family transcriptional regulator [Pseudomonas sp. BN505]|uniref:MarR family winged helix-turn-helix transcriptional regulator n=1 Tax=unclassified Pseudomonas TaxID=196821 RepID=UPI002458180C|nr:MULTISPECIES: MarR family transcriptional regulator [unclassified Pseudomonas]MDH4842258.1 MarR family transcriptional regulator [Pseudomonas sp. BN605]MDH4855113.1 MarR family transcriptional regulator [Pseudomonas sp. BN505]